MTDTDHDIEPDPNLEADAETDHDESAAANTQTAAVKVVLPRGRRGRPFNTSSPLGKIMEQRGLSARQVAEGTGIYNRTLTEYLARRRKPTASHVRLLSRFLGVHPSTITGYELVEDDPDGSKSASVGHIPGLWPRPTRKELIDAIVKAGIAQRVTRDPA